MSRSALTRLNQRVQVAQPTNTPSLDVAAPINVDVPQANNAAGWQQLQGLLLTGGKIYKETKDVKDKASEEQGKADRVFNKVDEERKAREDKYADGVEKAHVILQTQEAIATIDERASKELPPGTSTSEKMAWVDAQLMEELGPMAQDPKARLEIHDQVSDFYEKFAGREVIAARGRNQADSIAAVEVKIAQAIQGGNVDIGALINDVAPTFQGGRTEAWNTTIDIVARVAEEQHDESILAMLPSKVTTEDGQSIDSPILSRQNKERLNAARVRIAKHKEEVEEPLKEWHDAVFMRDKYDAIDRGEPLTINMFKDIVESGRMSAEQANSFVNAANSEIERRAKAAEEKTKDGVSMQLHGEASYLDLVGSEYPGAPQTDKQVQTATDMFYSTMVKNYSAYLGSQESPQTGRQLKDHPELTRTIFQRSRSLRLPMTSLKSYMSDINPAMGSTVLERLPVYIQAKVEGVETMYADEDTQALFEAALTAQRAGEKPADIIASIQRASDPSIKEYVKANEEKANKRVLSGDFDVVNSVFDIGDFKEVANRPMVEYRLKALSKVFLGRGLSPEKAAELAQKRFVDTHFIAKIDGKPQVIPKSPQFDSTAAAHTLETFESQIPAFATKKGDADPENARLDIRFGVNGRGTEVYIVGSEGTDIGGPYLLPQLIQSLSKKQGVTYRDAVNSRRKAQEIREREQRVKKYDRGFPIY